MAYEISSPIPVTSQRLYRKHNIHYVFEYVSTICDLKHTVLRQQQHTIYDITFFMSVQCDHTHSVDDIT